VRSGSDVDHAALGDCERVRPGPVGQPVNTVTSAAYLAAAVWVWRRRARRRALWAGALGLAGVGSLAYHGPGTRAGKALHDGALVVLALVAASGRSSSNRRLPVAAGLGAVAATIHGVTRTDGPACRPDSLLQGHAAWHVLSATSVALWADGE
jgi:drug/metabolite transporter (DMT)-like permease